MKLFTPDLLNRLGSANDDIADQAEKEWEEVAAKYRQYLQDIRETLPVNFLKLFDNYYLHDAKGIFRVEGFEQWSNEVFFLELIPASSSAGVLLHYAIVPPGSEFFLRGKKVERNDIELSQTFYWLYDEVELVRPAGRYEFTHDILFSNGLEVLIHFKEFQLTPDYMPADYARQKG